MVVGEACQRLTAANVPHNLFVVDCGQRVFLFPNAFARAKAQGEVPEKILDSQVHFMLLDLGPVCTSLPVCGEAPAGLRNQLACCKVAHNALLGNNIEWLHHLYAVSVGIRPENTSCSQPRRRHACCRWTQQLLRLVGMSSSSTPRIMTTRHRTTSGGCYPTPLTQRQMSWTWLAWHWLLENSRAAVMGPLSCKSASFSYAKTTAF